MVCWVPRQAIGRTPTPPTKSWRGHDMTPNQGSGTFTWAADVLADEQMVLPLDKDIDMGAASVVGCAVMTGAGAALNAAQVRPGDSVAVFGAGGVGLSTIGACWALGAIPIIVVDVTDEKLEFARQFGATHLINATKEDPIAKIRELMGATGGVDFAFDTIGVKSAAEGVLQVARPRRRGEPRPGGCAVYVGVPHGPAPQLDQQQLVNGKQARGAVGGFCEPDKDFPTFIRWHRDGKLPLDKLVSRRYSLDQINEACADLRAGKIAGRAIVEF
jgi:Zn-dependent alcohol dehydrogenase